MKNYLLIVIGLCCIFMCGCVATNYQQSQIAHDWNWSTFKFDKHRNVYTDSPIRWYEYDERNNWIMTGNKPYGILGALYTLVHPEWWFWYGQYGSMNRYAYDCNFKEGCEECELRKKSANKRADENYTKEEKEAFFLKRYGTKDIFVRPE